MDRRHRPRAPLPIPRHVSAGKADAQRENELHEIAVSQARNEERGDCRDGRGMNHESDGRYSDSPPTPSPRVALEVALLASAQERVRADACAALIVAARRTPQVIVVAHDERAVVRHLPAIPAVLLSDDTSALRGSEENRLAPIIALRGAFRGAQLLEVVASLL
jgi:hypothetical protein